MDAPKQACPNAAVIKDEPCEEMQFESNSEIYMGHFVDIKLERKSSLVIKNEISDDVRNDCTNLNGLNLGNNRSLPLSNDHTLNDNSRSSRLPGFRKNCSKYQFGQKIRILPGGETERNVSRLPSFSRFNDRKEKNYDCEKCNVSFSSSMTLQRHNRRIHSGIKSANTMSCVTCGKNFIDKNALLDHLKVHSDGESSAANIECGICNQKYAQRELLEMHIMRIHAFNDRYECKNCGRKYALKDQLEQHIKTHLEKIQQMCNECGKILSNRSCLRDHLLTHTGQKPYQCNICGKKFSQKNNMRQHKRTHTGERPYECKYCKFTFTQSVSLKKHLEKEICQNDEVPTRSRKRYRKKMLLNKNNRPQVNINMNGRIRMISSKKDDLNSHMGTHTVERPSVRITFKAPRKSPSTEEKVLNDEPKKDISIPSVLSAEKNEKQLTKENEKSEILVGKIHKRRFDGFVRLDNEVLRKYLKVEELGMLDSLKTETIINDIEIGESDEDQFDCWLEENIEVKEEHHDSQEGFIKTEDSAISRYCTETGQWQDITASHRNKMLVKVM